MADPTAPADASAPEFGEFELNVDLTAFQFGPTEIGAIAKGPYRPKDADELAALQHLCGISFTPEGSEESVPYATLTTGPAPAAAEPADIPPASTEPSLSEPPAGAGGTASSTAPELFTTTLDPSKVDTAAWPLAGVSTPDGGALYTWAGEGAAPSSAEWVAYSGPTKPKA